MDVSFPSSKDKPHMLFLLGGPGSGKGTQSAKLVRDLKYTHLSVGDLMRTEAKNKSKEGQEIEAIQDRGDLVPADLTVKILVKAIKAKNAKKYIIDGFPRNLDQALHFEKTFGEIDSILNLHCPDEVLTDRLLKRAASEGRGDDNPNTIRRRIQTFHELTEPTIEFYSRYGKVAHVSGEGSVDQVYNKVLQAVQPNLVFFYGPPASGQEQLAEQYSNLTGYNLLRVQEYYRSQGLQNATDEVKMDNLIAYLRDHHLRNFVLHGFPENIRQVKVFVEHFAAPKKFYYFDFTKDQVENNIKNRTKQQRQDILQEYDVYVKNRKDILPYFSKKPYFVRVQDSDVKEKIWQRLVEIVSPEVISCPIIPNDELSVGFIKRIERERGYVYVDFNELVNDEIKRGLNLAKGLQSGSSSAKIALLKKALYTDISRRRFIIGGYPDTVAALKEFEAEVCKVRHVLLFVHNEVNLSGDNIFGHYHIQGKLIKIRGNNIDQFDDYVQERCKYGFLIGTESAGRPIVANYLKGKFATQLIDFNQVTEMLKVKLATEENPDVEVKFSDILTYFKEEIATRDRSNNILFDGWPFERDQLIQFVKAVGIPNYVFYLNCSEDNLGKRWMVENKAEAVDEGELEKIKEDLGKVKAIHSAFQDVIAEGNNINLFDIAVEISNESTLSKIDTIIYKKVLVFRNLSQNYAASELKSNIVNACISNNVTFVDVAQLVNERIALNDDLGKKLQAQSKMTGSESLHPSLFTPVIITDLVNKSLETQPFTKYLMLYNYPAADTKEGDFFPRAIDELHQIEVSLGPVKQVISVQDSQEDYYIQDPYEEKPVIEEPVVETKVPKEGEEGEVEEQPPKEEEEGEDAKPKFNPLDYNWTISNANPKSLAKVFHRKKDSEHIDQQLNSQNLGELNDLLRESLARLERPENAKSVYYVETILS